MSALGRSEIIDRMRKGDLSISPILSRDQIGAASVDLRMGNVVLLVRARGLSHVDPGRAKGLDSHHARESSFQQKHERYELPFGSRLLIHPGMLAPVPTLEWVSLPADLLGAVTARPHGPEKD